MRERNFEKNESSNSQNEYSRDFFLYIFKLLPLISGDFNN